MIWEVETNTVYELFGCFKWLGCPDPKPFGDWMIAPGKLFYGYRVCVIEGMESKLSGSVNWKNATLTIRGWLSLRRALIYQNRSHFATRSSEGKRILSFSTTKSMSTSKKKSNIAFLLVFIRGQTRLKNTLWEFSNVRHFTYKLTHTHSELL